MPLQKKVFVQASRIENEVEDLTMKLENTQKTIDELMLVNNQKAKSQALGFAHGENVH